MATNVLTKLFGSKSERDLKNLQPIQNKILDAYEDIKQLSNDELRDKTREFKEKIHQHIRGEEEKIRELRRQAEEDYNMDIEEKENIFDEIDRLEKTIYTKSQEVLNEILPEAFAVMKETARRFKENKYVEVTANERDRTMGAQRDHIDIVGDKAHYKNQWMAGGTMITWDMVHYDVQLLGGVVLHQGKIAEMATGEGKTLVATLPVYLNALPGKGVHIVTVNDYLAKRDSEWMGVLYEFHGLTVDCIDKHQPNSDARKAAYDADVTFGTNNEFGFDYLRDNMARNTSDLVQRPHNYTIVDEVDSVLIDDARTPLIISGPTTQEDNQEFEKLKPNIQKLFNAQRNLINKTLAEAKQLLKKEDRTQEEEKRGAEQLFRSYRGLPKNKALIKFLSEPGIKSLMQKTENLYLQEQGKHMHIIDDELYFVIDEKHNTIDITEKGIDLLSETAEDPDFYILPDIGSDIAQLEKSGMSESKKKQKKEEMLRNYSIKSERVHTINQLLKAYTLFEKDVEYVVMDNKIKIVDEQTGRILEGRRYSDGLHQAIEAKENVKIEGATQTYATITLQNYFRMYNKLAGMTGTAETEAGEFWNIYELDVVVVPTNKPVIREDREDLVYKTKREKFNSVTDEIIKLINNNRPVLVGTTSVENSEVLSKMLERQKIKHNVLNAKRHAKEAQIVAEAGQPKAITIATNMAGRGTDIKLGPGVKEAGGLAILGTERHESRRVDRQLRGRAGRQGDPGSSQFFVSLEDDLMRMFGSERISKIMDHMGIEEGEVIRHSMITKSIERAQKKVEENNFGIRKRLLEYDDVMNSQREVIYRKRHHALYGDRLAVDISNMMYDVCEQIVADYYEARDFEGFRLELIKTLAADSPYKDEKEFMSKKPEEITQHLFEQIYNNYKAKCDLLAEKAYPVIEEVYEGNSGYENIAVPISDGRRSIQVIANLDRAYKDHAREVVVAMEKDITLATIDDSWKDHLREMDDLKQSVQNATYEQKDPLLIYKFESFELFKSMIQKINKEVSSFLIKGNLPAQAAQNVQEARKRRSDLDKLKEQRTDMLSQANPTQQRERPQPVKVEKKVGRNELCPCGSGKKYKHCHGKNA